MKKLLLCSLSLAGFLFTYNANSQVTFYTEDFDGALTWDLAADIGAEGANPNLWYVSCEEEGVGAGACGTGCGAGNQTLHVSTNVADLGAAYFETGTGATTTDRRAESGDISTLGYTGLTLELDYIGYGGNPLDVCELFYSTDGGTSWISLDVPMVANCCGMVPCDGALQGLWTTNFYPLPVACEGIANFRLSFVWRNEDDGTALDPSFAVDNINLVGTLAPCGVTAEFAVMTPDICVGDCIDFNDLSTGAITTWTWDFGDPAIAPSSTPSPLGVCFPNAGTWDVNLEVGDGICTHDTTITITVHDLPTVTANASPNDSLCVGEMVTLSGGGASTYTWDGGVTDGVPFTPAVGSATYNVTGVDGWMCENTASVTIVVQDCEPLYAGFTFPDPVCEGNCITLTDTTTGQPNGWSWDFGGGATPNTSTEQNPTVCFNDIGVFDIQLTVSDVFGQTSSTTNQITVVDAPFVIAWGDTTIDLGGTANLYAADTIGNLSYMWSPNYYINDPTLQNTTANPQFDTTYLVTVTDSAGCTWTDSVKVGVNFIEGIGVPSAFSPNGDGINDILFVKGIGITSLTFAVYNRYGEKVFETQDQSIGWDGMFRGREENTGVFQWVLEYTFVNGSGGIQKGNTTLVR